MHCCGHGPKMETFTKHFAFDNASRLPWNTSKVAGPSFGARLRGAQGLLGCHGRRFNGAEVTKHGRYVSPSPSSSFASTVNTEQLDRSFPMHEAEAATASRQREPRGLSRISAKTCPSSRWCVQPKLVIKLKMVAIMR